MTWLIVWSSLLFVLGLLLGALWGLGRGRDQGYGEYEDELGRLQARPPEVAHEPVPPPLIVQEDEPSLLYWRGLDQALAHPGQSCLEAHGIPGGEPPPYAWPAWSLLNADPPTLGEEIQAMIANANAVPSVRWLDRLEAGQ